MEDACHERYWVDRSECQDFTEVLLNSFETICPDKELLPPPEQTSSAGSSSPALITEPEPGFQEDLADIIQDNKVELEEHVQR